MAHIVSFWRVPNAENDVFICEERCRVKLKSRSGYGQRVISEITVKFLLS